MFFNLNKEMECYFKFARLSRSHFFATQLRNNSGDDDVIELMFCNRVFKLLEFIDGRRTIRVKQATDLKLIESLWVAYLNFVTCMTLEVGTANFTSVFT